MMTSYTCIMLMCNFVHCISATFCAEIIRVAVVLHLHLTLQDVHNN